MVVDGRAELWVADERVALTTGQSVVAPAGLKHGFKNTGSTTLHVRASLASPIFEAWFDGETEVRRRWLSQC